MRVNFRHCGVLLPKADLSGGERWVGRWESKWCGRDDWLTHRQSGTNAKAMEGRNEIRLEHVVER